LELYVFKLCCTVNQAPIACTKLCESACMGVVNFKPA